MLRRRHYTGQYPLATAPGSLSALRSIIALILIALVLFYLGRKVMQFFNVGNAVRQNAAVLLTEGPGTVNVSIDGGELKRAENRLKLYPKDQVTTSGNARAALALFDGTIVRLDTTTTLQVVESEHGVKQSRIVLALNGGSAWISTPTVDDYSGSILREIHTTQMNLTLPSRTEVVVTPSAFTTFAADGQGISVLVAGNRTSVIIGEGQQFTIPAGAPLAGNLYRFRSPLDPLMVRSSFVEESRSMRYSIGVNVSGSGTLAPPETESQDVLTVSEPTQGITLETATVKVIGSVRKPAEKVRINGYIVETTNGRFEREISLPDEDEVTVLVEALNADGTVNEKIQRILKRDRKPPEAPIILTPAKAGETYATMHDPIEISGEAPDGTVGIVVNDYRLQLFTPGERTWSYLASTKLANMQPGSNTYSVVAINKGGYRSTPAVITILFNQGQEGLVKLAGTGAAAPSTIPTEDAATLPDNAPLSPGSLAVTGPAAGTQFTSTGSSFLLEGITSPATASIWVNDYRLKLYLPGKITWNYIADVQYGTLSRGRNLYRIVTRDKNNMILDTLTYTVRY
ncbi:MAG: hypothetical protein PHH13_00065 [Candidatus Peribacteraceae bacterium]|nr:hypothetical protein [Candidatus Peribacteraceae bacterium]